MASETDSGYRWSDAELTPCHEYVLPAVERELTRIGALLGDPGAQRVFDLGCGNGSVAQVLSRSGWEVVGVDPSEEGIRRAREAFPSLSLFVGSAYDDLRSVYGTFPVVVSLEVVEHVYWPRRYARCLFDLLETGGHAIISTPYHGYVKNLAMAVTGRLDQHFTALWDHGHIKFWSIKTLTVLLREAGFGEIRFLRVGRVPPLAKSMIAVARKP